MIAQTTALLRSIWETSLWRDNVLVTFENWVQNNASRSDVKNRLRVMIEAQLMEQAGSHTRNIDLELVNWEQLTEFLCLCFYRKRLRHALPDIPPDEVWIKLSDEQSEGPLSSHPQQNKAIKETVPVPLFALEQKLLAYGGTRMIYRHEPDLKPLLKRGEVFDEPTEFLSREAHYCHSNVAQLWNENRETLAIVTGYALSDDGLWRQHSWLIRKNPDPGQYRVLETTLKRVKYFGFILTDNEAEVFYEANR